MGQLAMCLFDPRRWVNQFSVVDMGYYRLSSLVIFTNPQAILHSRFKYSLAYINKCINMYVYLHKQRQETCLYMYDR